MQQGNTLPPTPSSIQPVPPQLVTHLLPSITSLNFPPVQSLISLLICF